MKRDKLVVYLTPDMADEVRMRAGATNLSISSYIGLLLLNVLHEKHRG